MNSKNKDIYQSWSRNGQPQPARNFQSPPDKGDLGGWLCIGSVQVILKSTINKRLSDIAEHGELAEQVPPLYTVIQAARAAHGKGMQSYLIMMSTRLLEMERILKDTGSIYLHCDPTASHYLKLVMDGIFGKGNFRAEIAWHYSGGNARLSKSFSSRHDVILFYGKSDKQNRSSIDIALLWSEGLSIKSSCESLNLQNPDSDNNPCNPRHPFNPRFRQYNKKSRLLKNRPKKPNFSQVL